MPDLKIQEANLLLQKILSNPKTYHLQLNDKEISGNDEKINFRFYKDKEKVNFEVKIDDLIFVNNTGDWNNAMIMLGNTIKKIEKEKERLKIEQAIEKLKKYLSEEN